MAFVENSGDSGDWQEQPATIPSASRRENLQGDTDARRFSRLRKRENGEGRNLRIAAGVLQSSPFPPSGTVAGHPVQECMFESNVVAGPFTLEPFVPEDLIPLGEKLPVEYRRPLIQAVVGQ
jgi:hypothetical protein